MTCRRTLLATLLALALPASASASVADLAVLPAEQRALTVASAAAKDCTRAQSGAGVWSTQYAAPTDGYVHLQLAGGRADDWDLALFGEDGALRAASQSFGAREVVSTYVRAGRVVTIQACRRAGETATLGLTTTFTRLPASMFTGQAPKMSIVRVTIPSREGVHALEELGFDVGHDIRRNRVDVTTHSPAQLSALRKLGFPLKVLVDDVVAHERAERAKDAAATRSGQRSVLPTGRTDYRTYEDIQAELKELVAKHPGKVRPITLEHETFQGRAVEGIEIAEDVAAVDGRPSFLLAGVHHAREWPSVESVMEFAHFLLGSEARATKLRAGTRVTIVPLINPDGYVESRSAPVDDPEGDGPYTAYALIGAGAQRRKNCFGPLPAAAPCAAQHGVDPNRNYGQFWGGPGASATPEQQDYRGDGPFSEPETKNVQSIAQKTNFTAMLTIHNVAALVLRAPGLKSQGLAPDEPALKALGDAMGKATGYTSQYGWQLYDTTGTTEDYLYAATGMFGYTIEMGPSGGVFHPNYQEGVINEWEGQGRQKGQGLKEAYTLAAEAASNLAQHSVLTGRSQPGAVLKVKKGFTTFSSAVCTANSSTGARVITAEGTLRDTIACAAPGPVIEQPETYEYTMTVPASGDFKWVINPSTRPFELRAGKQEQWTLTCTDPKTSKVFDEQQVLVGRGETRQIDLPCGGVLPERKSILDKLAPVSKILRKTLKASRKGVYLQGTSADRAPAGATPELNRVTVAVGRRSGSKCQWLNASGKLGKKVSCLRVSPYLRAAGTSQWTFKFATRLRPGKYLAWVRGVDKAGNRERKSKSRNLVTFRVR